MPSSSPPGSVYGGVQTQTSSTMHRRRGSDVSLDRIEMSERDIDAVQSEALLSVEGAAVRGISPKVRQALTHASYNPEVTNPMRCLDVGGGDADRLRRVPADRSSKMTREFYEEQNQTIQSFCDMEKLRQEVRSGEFQDDADDEDDATAKIAIRASFFANVLILGAKVVLVIRTGSVAFIASLLDSVLDLLSGLALVITNKLVNDKRNVEEYPLGKRTFEPLGTLVFACCMFTASFQLLKHAVDVLAKDSHEVEVDISSMIFISCIIAAKFFLMLYCRKFANGRPSVEALAADHRNDVASNLVGVVAAVLAERFYWRIDPISAILITFYIMYIWATTGYEQVLTLSGKSAPVEVLRQLTYAAQHHHPSILFVDTVRAVALGGDGYFVEVDVVLSPETPLRESHDIGESLQIVLEKLHCVSRAYVHLDYEFAHAPSEHR